MLIRLIAINGVVPPIDDRGLHLNPVVCFAFDSTNAFVCLANWQGWITSERSLAVQGGNQHKKKKRLEFHISIY